MDKKNKKNFKQLLISGLKSTKLPKDIDELSFNTKYFHNAENFIISNIL